MMRFIDFIVEVLKAKRGASPDGEAELVILNSGYKLHESKPVLRDPAVLETILWRRTNSGNSCSEFSEQCNMELVT